MCQPPVSNIFMPLLKFDKNHDPNANGIRVAVSARPRNVCMVGTILPPWARVRHRAQGGVAVRTAIDGAAKTFVDLPAIPTMVAALSFRIVRSKRS
jgi:hypothetical protein